MSLLGYRRDTCQITLQEVLNNNNGKKTTAIPDCIHICSDILKIEEEDDDDDESISRDALKRFESMILEKKTVVCDVCI